MAEDPAAAPKVTLPSSAICVIFNPAAGRGQAAKRLRSLRHRLGANVAWRPTDAAGHAVELARQAALEGFSVVAAAGGDGTVHEVANGILEAGRPAVGFAILPLGSANDYLASLDYEAQLNDKREGPRLVDVGLIRSAPTLTLPHSGGREPDGRHKYFVCCLGIGFNGMVTTEARKIRSLQGIPLYGLATLKALWYRYQTPRMTIAFDDEPEQTTPTLLFSVMVGRREGGFVLAPEARLDDGQFDIVHARDLSRWEVVKFLPRVALFGPPRDHPKISLRRCRKLRLRSEAPLIIHADGEFFCTPDEDVRAVEVELLPRALRIVDLRFE